MIGPGHHFTGRQSDLRHNRTQSPPHRKTWAPIRGDAVRSRNHLTQADTVDPGITYTGRLSWTWETSPCPPPGLPLSPHSCTHSDTALAPQSNTFPAKSPRTRASCRSSQSRASRAPTTDWKHLRAAPFSFCFTYGQHWLEGAADGTLSASARPDSRGLGGCLGTPVSTHLRGRESG